SAATSCGSPCSRPWTGRTWKRSRRAWTTSSSASDACRPGDAHPRGLSAGWPPPAPRAPAARARWAAASGSSGSHLELRTQIHRTGPGSTAPPGDTPDPDGPEPPTAYAPELFPGPVALGPLAGPGQGRARSGQVPIAPEGGAAPSLL